MSKLLNTFCLWFLHLWSRRLELSDLTLLLFRSVQSVQSLSRVRLFATPWIPARQASLSITNSGVHSDSRPSTQWCHPAISSSVVPFSSCPQSLPASGSFPMSQLFTSAGQSIGVSALASFLPKKSQGWSGWSPSEWSCSILCDPMDCSPPGSSVHGVSQARRLEWVSISFSRASSWPRDWTWVSCIGRWILYHQATWEPPICIMIKILVPAWVFSWTKDL